MAIKQAKVCEVYPEEMAVRVVYEDRDNLVSAKLPVMCQGSGTNFDYWLPDVGEQVIVNESEDGKGLGFVIGSYYSKTVPPECQNPDVRRTKFSNGDYVEHNRKTGDMNIRCSGNLSIVCNGNITIKGARIDLNP